LLRDESELEVNGLEALLKMPPELSDKLPMLSDELSELVENEQPLISVVPNAIVVAKVKVLNRFICLDGFKKQVVLLLMREDARFYASTVFWGR